VVNLCSPIAICDDFVWLRGPLPLIANRGQSLFTDRDLRGPLPLITNQSKTNAQCLHQKVFVETNHTNHNILSFDAADDRQQKSGWMSADHNTTCLTFLHRYLMPPAVAERLRRAYPAPLGRAGVGSITANSDAQNVPSFRRWRFEMKLSPF
jgi:hypothetical protein